MCDSSSCLIWFRFICIFFFFFFKQKTAYEMRISDWSSDVCSSDLHPVWLHRQVGDDEADFGEQLARMPFDLGDDAARLVPGRRLILEVLEEPFDLGQRRPSHGPCQPMRDLLAQDGVGGQTDGVEEPG